MFSQLSFATPVDSLVVKTDSSDVRHQVLIKTSMGDITVELYNETPRHRDNFLRLAREGYFDGNLWHRVISDFMIQTGDSTTRHAAPGVEVGEYTPDRPCRLKSISQSISTSVEPWARLARVTRRTPSASHHPHSSTLFGDSRTDQKAWQSFRRGSTPPRMEP